MIFLETNRHLANALATTPQISHVDHIYFVILSFGLRETISATDCLIFVGSSFPMFDFKI